MRSSGLRQIRIEGVIFPHRRDEIVEGAAWTGRGARTGGGAQAGTRDGVVARAKANGLSRDQQMWRDAGALSQKQINSQKRWGGAPKIDVNAAKKPEKKFFGLF